MTAEDFQFKKELIAGYLRQLEGMAETSRIEMADHQTQANEYGPPKDRYDSFRTKLLRMRDMFAAQYQKILDEIQLLGKINPAIEMEKPGLGAVVFLERGIFFVAPGGGKLTTTKGDVWILTPQSPLFKAIKDLKRGQNFVFNGKNDCLIKLF